MGRDSDGSAAMSDDKLRRAPPELAELRERIRAAQAGGTALRLRGGGTKDFYGSLLSGAVLDTSGYRGVVSYEPTELVITARCGTPLSELRGVLAEKGQMLPFEPPAFGAGATIGGTIAAGLAGPRRMAAGAARDFVLGVALLDGRGVWLEFGGRVMKNVAGYDVSRLACGSLGTLGVIAEVSLKVMPLPAAELSVLIAATEADALALTSGWAARPLPVSATSWADGELRVRLSGAVAAVAEAANALGADHGAVAIAADQASHHWEQVREHRAAFFAGDQVLWRIAVPDTAPPLGLPGATLIEWSGAQRWVRSSGAESEIRAAARAAGGHASAFRGGNRGAGVFEPLPEPLAAIHRRLKARFDPAGILNPGRMYPDL